MPELPEVETVRRGLAATMIGERIKGVEVIGPRTVRRHAPGHLVGRVTGQSVVAVARRGKYLVVALSSGDRLVIHLRMSGQLLWTQADVARPKHVHAVLSCGDGRELRFVDPRTFGELFVAEAGAPCPALDGLGAEPLEVELGAFRALLAGRRRQLKALLLDQAVFAGIGNIYSDEMLFAARLRADRASDTVSAVAARRLHEAMRAVLTEAIEAGGSSLADGQYVDVFGRPGDYRARHRVYGREGRPCPVCGRAIERRVFGQRSTFFCRRCQR